MGALVQRLVDYFACRENRQVGKFVAQVGDGLITLGLNCRLGFGDDRFGFLPGLHPRLVLQPLADLRGLGDGVLAYVLRALPTDRGKDEAYVQAFIKRYRKAYTANWANKTRSYDGVPEMLRGLSSDGLTLTVLSNKPDDFTREMVRHFLGEFDFAIVRGALDSVPLKPDPAAALAIAREINVDPAAFLYLGDTATDMQTARAAGMFAVGALWGFRAREELTAGGAQAVIETPGGLLRFIT